jgi:hypothetical protein
MAVDRVVPKRTMPYEVRALDSRRHERPFRCRTARLPHIARTAKLRSLRRLLPARFRGRRLYVGGKVVVNPCGGLISKGHPLGATGLAQCAELNRQLRGESRRRQVEGAELVLQHNLGLGGAAVVALYQKGFA